MMLSIGEIIRTNREAREVSQEVLAYGICSSSTLSRVENGTQIPSRTTYDALMERLGVSPEIFPSFLDDRELEAFRLKHQINQKIITGKYGEVEAMLEKLEAIPKLERVYVQHIRYVRAILLRRNGGALEDVLEEMKKVADLSIKDATKILRQILTKDELSILNNLAISYYHVGDRDKAIDILYAAKEYIERKVVDDEGISPMYTAILHSLTNCVGLRGRHEEVLRLCELGINRCIEYGAYFSFAALLFNKGYALVMLNRKDEAKNYIQEAYYINRARKNITSCEITKKFADEQGIEI